MTKNVKMAIFVEPETYICMKKEADQHEIRYRSDSELLVRLYHYYRNKTNELKAEVNQIQDRIVMLNKVIQQKEAVITKTVGRRKK